MKYRPWIGSFLLLITAIAAGGGLAAWKIDVFQAAEAASANPPEPIETVSVAVAQPRERRQTVSAIGTVLAMRSVTLRNELPGTVDQVMLTPGKIVDAGTVLVRLDVSVESAELQAQRAQAALAETLLERYRQASQNRAVSEIEVERARAERDVALAQIARTEAIIARKTLRAPFRARVGLADVHPGQYLDEGTELTTLQGVDGAVHVDFSVSQQVASNLRQGQGVDVSGAGDRLPVAARIVAIDARVDRGTRNALVRARLEGAGQGAVPGTSVRVQVPVGPSRTAVAVPASALRKGPGGDHVFVIAPDGQGLPRARLRAVQIGALHDDQIVIDAGLAAGERVAASGSFKLQEAMLVAISEPSRVAASAK